MLNSKLVSSLEKGFINSDINSFDTFDSVTVLKNERFSFQLMYTFNEQTDPLRAMLALKVSGGLSEYARVREVINLPVLMPVSVYDDNYLSTEPGLYPDLLEPLHYGGVVSVVRNQTHSVWIEIDLRKVKNISSGDYTFEVCLCAGDEICASHTLNIEVIDACLPPQKMYLTQWFHCDCLANYYNCPVWSDEHWRIIENFATVAKSNGINLLLTPVFTPPLDTAVGGERLTTQLIDVIKTGDIYSFDFSMLDKWINMCDRIGIEYFEISHLFTQWGATHAPKVMAHVDGEYKKLFGWETEATSEDYTKFLRTFLSAFLTHMKARGDDKRCLFHISDEPNGEQLDSYRAAKDSIADLLDGYIIMDALSNYEFYREGIVSTPIPSNNHIEEFIENDVKDLWTYYCCGQCVDVSNRLISMPSWRNRSIGMQLYRFNIVGFLQWGYNFYNNMSSCDAVNPYIEVSGDFWVPAGDAYSVYPASDGTARESLRIIVFYEALQDMRAMQLCESLCGREKVVSAIESAFGQPIKFSKCAHSADEVLRVRDAVNKLIKASLTADASEK